MDGNKIVLIGQSGVGKTSIVQRCLALGLMDQATIGVSFYRKIIKILDKDIILNIWDTSGQERYSPLTKIYIRGAVCAIIVFDVTDRETFDSLTTWKHIIDDFQIPHCIIIANKTDKNNHAVTELDIQQWCSKNSASSYFIGSALNNEGINDLLTKLAGIVSNNNRSSYGTMNNISLSNNKDATNGCSC